eukprot:TRINITY_DN3795_c0_g1_i1.p1 TRINITY_DN3795_c0_g1~~TRINITY_DN3795_c0_g1_i1.p1  ORF type:complete len:326 (-),score=0.71 TRINITY_DN3795_c0_g1_i1:92-997(-)
MMKASLFLCLCFLNLLSVYCLHKEPLEVCGTPCTDNLNCSASTACSVCRMGFCVGQGLCNSYCDPKLGVDYYCYNDYCQYCDNATKSCRSDCTGPCASDIQCGGSCNFCKNYACVGACKAPCQTSDDCANNLDGCTQCINNQCAQPAGCGIYCTNNLDCINNLDGCTKCVRNQCIPGGCGSKCYWTPDCAGQGNCTQCQGRFGPDGYGLCTAICGNACVLDSDCYGNLTNCGQCYQGICRPSTACGVGCMNVAGCAGNCHRCINNVCTKNAGCGEACDVNDVCDQTNPSCMYCINQRCGHP